MNLNEFKRPSKLSEAVKNNRVSLGGSRTFSSESNEKENEVQTPEEETSSEEFKDSTKITDFISERNRGIKPSDFRIVQVDVNLIDPYDLQAREDFSPEEMKELSWSIKENGLINPIHLIEVPGTNRFQVIAGERRLRAVKELGLNSINAIITKKDNSTLLKSIIDNYQRSNLNVLEKGRAFNYLLKEGICKDVEEVSLKMGGVSPKVIYECISLWKNTPESLRGELIKDPKLTRATLREKTKKDDKKPSGPGKSEEIHIVVKFSKKGASVIVNKEYPLSTSEKNEIKELFEKQLGKIDLIQ